MTDFSNVAEIREQTRRQRVEAKQALWAGRSAFLDGIDAAANPHGGWEKLTHGLHTHQCLLWCRWMYGWLTEFHLRRGGDA